MALALLPFLAYALLSPVSGRRRIDALGDRARQALGEMSAHTADTIQGLADLTAFQATGRRRDEFLQAADRYRERRLSMQRDLSRQNANFELAAGLGGLAVAVTGGLQVAAGTLSAGMLPLLVLIALATFLPVSEISQVSRQLADTIAATRRLHVVSHEPVPVNDGPADAPVSTQGLSLAFEHVSFAYPGKRDNTLKDLSFTVPAGATVAVVGASGAGKSTVASLLLRFWDPQSGAVRLDGADLRGLKLDSLRERSRWSLRTPTCSTTRWRATSCWPAPRPAARNSSGRWNRPRWRISSRHCPTACAPASANAACSCRAASASASRSRGRS